MMSWTNNFVTQNLKIRHIIDELGSCPFFFKTSGWVVVFFSPDRVIKRCWTRANQLKSVFCYPIFKERKKFEEEMKNINEEK
jgi:hypothetical protein